MPWERTCVVVIRKRPFQELPCEEKIVRGNHERRIARGQYTSALFSLRRDTEKGRSGNTEEQILADRQRHADDLNRPGERIASEIVRQSQRQVEDDKTPDSLPATFL